MKEQKQNETVKTSEKKKRTIKSKSVVSKIRGHKFGKYDMKLINKSSLILEKLGKKNIAYFVLFLLDIIFVIYLARRNIVNYVEFSGHDIFITDKKNMFFGRNYINVIVTVFFYIYFCMINRFILKEKNTKKFLFILFFILVVLNGLLFYLFTKRVY